MGDRATRERYPEDFLTEAREIVQRFSDDVLALEEREGAGEVDPAILQRIFRAAHSLKGLAGMFGAGAVASLAHAVEDLLDALRLGRERVSREVIDLLLEVSGLFESLLSGEPAEEAAAEHAARLRRMARAAGPRTLPPPPYELPRDVLEVLTEYEIFRLHEAAARGRHVCGVRREMPVDRIEEELGALRARLERSGEVVTAAPTHGGTADRIAFIVLAATDLSPDDLARELGQAVDAYPRIPAREETPAPHRSVVPPSGGTVRVEIARLDALMTVIGELGGTRTTLSRIAERLQAEPGLAGYGLELAREVRTLERRLRELRQGVLEARLVPLAPLFARMARVVRGLARDAGKDIAFASAGGETEIDKFMAEQISDPLVQLLRNAVDHGIEPAAVRQRLGKPAQGRVSLEARADGNRVVLTVRDDGAGIDLDRVREVAVAQGLLSAEASRRLGARETLALLFLPGFSTRPSVSEISGRGVGLDVVQHNIGRLAGSIEVETELGRGTDFVLTLPVTLAILPVLLVRAGGETVALPMSAVVETARSPHADRHGDEIWVRGERIPRIPLARRLGFGSRRTDGISVVVAVGDRSAALDVDDVVGQQDVVIKPLGRLLGDVPCVSGVAELGGGDLILVLDLPSLLLEPGCS